ncbi:branched-chain amino acid aminotransferase [Lysinibacillus sphaericus]
MGTDKLNVEALSIDVCNKETDELIRQESSSFLEEPLKYLKTNENEYIFLEADVFEEIRIDGLSLELDDLFGHYDAMFGLKLQKKYREEIVSFFQSLQGKKGFNLLFNGEDGLWDVNLSLNDLPAYHDDMTVKEAVEELYSHLSGLLEKVQGKK